MLFTNDQAFLHEPLDEDDLLLVFQIAGKIADGISSPVEREIQSVTKEARKDNGPAPEVETDGFVTRVRPVNDARAWPNNVVRAQLSCLKEGLHLTRNVERR